MNKVKVRVKGHIREGVKVHGYTYNRKTRPKAHKGIHKAYTKKAEITYFTDSNGRLVSKRIYKPLGPAKHYL